MSTPTPSRSPHKIWRGGYTTIFEKKNRGARFSRLKGVGDRSRARSIRAPSLRPSLRVFEIRLRCYRTRFEIVSSFRRDDPTAKVSLRRPRHTSIMRTRVTWARMSRFTGDFCIRDAAPRVVMCFFLRGRRVNFPTIGGRKNVRSKVQRVVCIVRNLLFSRAR